MPIPKDILYLKESDVQQTLTVAEAVDLAEKGIKADAAGNVVGNKFYMPVDENGFIKPFSGYISGEDLAFVKTFSYFPGNPEKYKIPTTSSVVILFDVETGLPTCFMEASWVTGLKTAASTAVTAAYLSRPESETLTVFGAGTLGRLHLRSLARRFKFQKAFILDIFPEVAQACAQELSLEADFPVEVIPLDEREKAVRSSDIIITVTTFG
jgi:ornithine cyclodeaminase/alanine dehydrogenase-like protein (mu-crystallin family)